jgi:segregation and condensation protein B
MKIEDENEATSRLEAALYSAGRPLTVEELIKARAQNLEPRPWHY